MDLKLATGGIFATFGIPHEFRRIDMRKLLTPYRSEVNDNGDMGSPLREMGVKLTYTVDDLGDICRLDEFLTEKITLSSSPLRLVYLSSLVRLPRSACTLSFSCPQLSRERVTCRSFSEEIQL